jgi:preprotein translocase subunit SecD
MERKWWWKTIGVLFLMVLSVVYLVPTFMGDLDPKDKNAPGWYKTYAKYVKAKLNMGLDLQGGIHLVFEVEVDKAVADKADRC